MRARSLTDRIRDCGSLDTGSIPVGRTSCIMTAFDILLQVVILSGVVGAFAGGLVNYLSSKNLDVHVRAMETRKRVYTRVNELFAAFYSTATDEETKTATDELLKCFREIQIWGSDEVVKSFQEVLFAIDLKNDVSQEERNLTFKKFIVAMRRDILGKTKILPKEIAIHGRIESRKK